MRENSAIWVWSRAVVAGGALLLSLLRTEAATKTWLGGTSSDWNTAGNWQGGVPLNGDDLVFTNSPAFQPSNNNIAGLTPNSLLFSNTSAITLGGNQITLGPATFAGTAMTFGRNTTTATATNASPHGLIAGQIIAISGSVAPFNGVYQIASAPSSTTLTFTVANSGATVGNGSVARAATVENLNGTGGRDVTITLPMVVTGGTQQWNIVSSNGVVLISGNLTGSSNIILSTHDTRSAVPALRLEGTNAGFTGHILPGASTTAGTLLMHPAAMTAGNIDLGASDRNVWLKTGAGLGTYTMGFGGGTNAINFRNSGQGGLKVWGGNGTWDPGNGGNYTTVGMTNPRVRIARSLVDTNGLFFGNSSSRLILSTNGMVVAFAEGGLAASPVVSMRFALSDDGVARNFTVGEGGNSWPGVVALSRAATGGSLGGKTIVDVTAALSVSSMDQLFDGNLDIRAGTLVLDGVSWASFAADRSGGNGSGANQWMITNGGGFAARSTALTIPSDTSGGLSASTFDINFQLGHGAPDSNGLIFANMPVVMARSTTLTGRRQISIAPTGQGLYPSNANTIISTLSASFSGTGSLMIVGGNYGTAVSAPTNLTAEVIVSGTNTWSGPVTNVSINGAIFNSGPGGLFVRDALIRFDGDAALPSGNGGSPSLIAALQRNSTDFGFGFLFAGGTTEKVYDLPTSSRMAIGSLSTAQDPGVLGATEGLTKLRSSTVLLHDGADSFSPLTGFAGYPLALLVRDGGVFTLGDAGAPVRFVPSKGQDAGTSLSAMSVSDAVAAGFTNRTLMKRGEGTLVLKNVSYTDVAETGNKAAAFTWVIGRASGGNNGSAAYSDGAVRGLSPNDAGATDANSLKNFHIALRGGVYEIDNSGGGSGTFNRWVSINVAAVTNISIGNISGATALGGGGFSAYGGDVVIDLNTNGARDVLTWGQSGSGFIQSNDPLIFGSQTANATVEFYDTINLNNGTREFRVIDNTNAGGDKAVISGTITGVQASVLIKTGSGLLELRGTNTYSGGTVVSNGVLLVNTASGSGTGTNTVSVTAGAKFGGSGTISGAVVMASGTELLVGSSTNAGVGHLRLSGGLTMGTQSLFVDMTNAAGVAGTDWDLITVGSGTGTVTFSGTPTITLYLRASDASLPGFDLTTNRSWLIVDAGVASGFDTNTFVVSTNYFAPAIDGSFAVTQQTGKLYLSYTPNVPVDLSIAVSQSASLLDVGTPMTYTLLVSNVGPVQSAAIVVSNILGATVSYSGSSGGGVHSAGVVRWSLPALAVGATTSLTVNVAAALAQGAFTNRATVMMPARQDTNTANNAASIVATAVCPGAPLPFLNAASNRTVFQFNNLSFNIVASNTDCSTPFLDIGGKPAAATFTTATNGYVRTGTFSWTPGALDVGTHPLRFYAYNAGGSTSQFHLLVYVAQTGESTNSAGVPLSQTNWHVAITNVVVPTSGNATVRWVSVSGVAYDLYSSSSNFGQQTMSWTKEVDGVVATDTQLVRAVTNTAQKYLQVVPAGMSPGSANLWAMIRPSLAPGFTLFAAPLSGSDLKFNGAFGTNLASALSGHNSGTGDYVGDEVFLLNADGSYSNLYLDAAGVWRTSGGSVATHELVPGQGVLVLRNGLTAAQPSFTGPVGNTQVHTNRIAPGTTILTFSEGKYLTPAQAFASPLSGTPVASYDENEADQLIFVDPDGSFRPVQRLPDGTWLDLTTFGSAGYLFTPGSAAFYLRQSSGGTMEVRF